MWNSPRERICLEERRHGIVLARPFAKALGLGAFGAGLSWIGGPLTIPGALVLACAAFVAVRAAWEWESTRLVVTTEKLYVTYGFWRRRAAGVHLARTRTLEVEQTLPGRLLGYGTLIAGELEVDYIGDPWRVWLVQSADESAMIPGYVPCARPWSNEAVQVYCVRAPS